ncbi:MAG: hypothetical protein HY791_37120 [Deltaproteobacteria bacterium]|nr:hypothetical protein [Deltaproteobacteria bacterium]
MTKFNPVRDTISAGIAVAWGFTGGPLGLAGGLVGAGFKKAFVAEDSSFMKKFMVGAAATLLTAGFGLLPYLIAAPGAESKKDVQSTRSQVVDNRYGA